MVREAQETLGIVADTSGNRGNGGEGSGYQLSTRVCLQVI